MSATTMSQLADYRAPSLAERLRPLRSPWRAFRRRLLRRPASTLGTLFATVAAGAIVTNALALQTDRHPSPLFKALNAPTPLVETATAAIPTPPVRPQQLDKRADVTNAGSAKEPRAQRIKDEPQRTASIQTTPKDHLLAVINESAPTSPAQDLALNRKVLVQKALIKAGYGPLKADGNFGASSKAAMERFEADRKLPIKGEPQGKSLRELARVSGMALD